MVFRGKKWFVVVRCGIFFAKEDAFKAFGDKKMFRGVNGINIDAKGRIAMPTRYRESLQQAGIGHLVESGDVLSLLDLLPGKKPERSLISFIAPPRPAALVLPAVMLTAIGVVAYLGLKAFRNTINDVTSSAEDRNLAPA